MWIQILAVYLLVRCSHGNQPRRALVVIDVQKCFIHGGNLAVPSGEDVVPVINGIREKYENQFQFVYFSLDYHPANHVSFASQHQGKKNFETTTLKYNDKAELCGPTTLKNETNRVVKCDKIDAEIRQTLWPDHCVSGTGEVNMAGDLVIDLVKDKFIYKGNNHAMDSYSAFFDNGHLSETNLHKLLQCDNIEEIFVVGLSTDICVKLSALDGVEHGYKVYVVEDATRIVEVDKHDETLEEMRNVSSLLTLVTWRIYLLHPIDIQSRSEKLTMFTND